MSTLRAPSAKRRASVVSRSFPPRGELDRPRSNAVRLLFVALFLLAFWPVGVASADNGADILHFTTAEADPAFLDRLLYAAFRRIGYEATVQTANALSSIQMANDGERDGLVAQMEGLEKIYPNLVMIPESIGEVRFEVYARQDSSLLVRSWQDLRGLRLASFFPKYKFYHEDRIRRAGIRHIKKRKFFELIDALEADECDVIVVANVGYRDLPIPPGVKKVGVAETSVLYPYLNGRYAALAPEVAQALRFMKADGSFGIITDQKAWALYDSKTILVITSYSADDVWEDALNQGIIEQLLQRANITHYSVSLNSNRIQNDVSRAWNVLETIRASFIFRAPDLVIATDPNAMTFVMNYHYLLFGDKPVVLSGMGGNMESERWKLSGECRTISGDMPGEENVNLILELFPRTRNLFVVNDYTEGGVEWRRRLEEELRPFEGRLHIEYSEDGPLGDLLAKLGGLPKDTVVLFGRYSVDGERRWYSQQGIQTKVGRHCKVPVFGTMGGSIGYGQIGGRYADPSLYGRAAVNAAIEMLDGEDGSAAMSDGLCSWVFDENEMKKWRIRRSQLPAEARIINHRPSPYEANPQFYSLLGFLFFLTLLVIGILSLLVGVLRKNNRRLVDIQKDLHSAEELLRKDEEIRGINVRLETALAASSSGVWEIDLTAGVVRYDKVTEEMFGFDAGGCMAIEKFIERMDEIAVDIKNPGFYREILLGDIAQGTDVDRDMIILRPDGSQRYLSAHLKLFHDAGGLAEKIIGMLIDITTQAEMARELRTARDAAEAANRAKSYFLSSISHEIRTPMNAIIGMSELLLTENLTERQLKYMQDIQVSATSLLGIINDILDVSKIDAGKFRLAPVDFDLNALLANLQTMFSFAAQERGILFFLDADECLPRCLYGDDVRIRQILVNVIGNGIKFTDRGHVLLQVFSRGGRLCFDVSDTGVGIRSEYLDSLFDSFAQFDEDKKRKIVGTGLGLAITKSLVDLMEGSIGVESELGVGTTFRIAIPLVEGDGDRLSGTKGDVLFVVAPDAKVLVVDDNEINLNVACGMLRLHRINADRALSGREALERVGGARYDLVLMDHMMPEMDGIETTREIRRDGENARVPVVALTANAVEGVRDTLIMAGMDDYLAKPIQSALLNEMLAKWLPPEKVAFSTSPYREAGKKTDRGLIERIMELPEVDPGLALERIGGMADVYEESLAIMARRLPESLENLASFLADGDMRNYAILIHGMKGSLDNIGASELAARARALEAAAKRGDDPFCREEAESFLEALRVFHGKLSAILAEEKGGTEEQREPGSFEDLKERLTEARTLLHSFLDIEAANIVTGVRRFTYDCDLDRRLENLQHFILEFDYDRAIALIDSIVKER